MLKRIQGAIPIVTALIVTTLAGLPAPAQWLKLPVPGPRTADGKLDLAGPAPRRADRTPDLSGIWHAANTKYLVNLGADFKPGELPILPWAEALTNQRKDGSLSAQESDANCLPPGLPKINATPDPFKIIQQPDLVVILYEAMGLYRQIFMDGRELARDLNPTWLGYSLGHWDGDTLVVETTGLNGKPWLDKAGHPTSEALHVTERFRRRDFGHLEIQVTIDDPKVFTKPWSVTENVVLFPNTELIENVCNENEQDVKHMPGK
jgi:hypothetical protein